MLKNKRFSVMLLLIMLFILFVLSSKISNEDFETKKAGIDLTNVNFEKDIVQLNTKWEFYWKELLDPYEISLKNTKDYINVPGTWNKFPSNDEKYSGDGFATYKLRFLINEDEKLGVKIPTIRSAYKLWINGEEKSSAGVVAENKKSMKAQYQPQVNFFEAKKGENEIVIQVSNFHQRSGGILESISLASEDRILRQRYISVGRDIFLFGSLLTISIYNLSFFIFRRQNKSFLYFGVLSLFLAIRTLLVRETMFLFWFPNFSWEIAVKIKALTFYLSVPLFLMLIESIFPNYLNKIVIRLSRVLGLLFGLIVIFTTARFYSVINIFYQIWSIMLLVYIVFKLLQIHYNKEKNSEYISFGVLVLLFTVLNDILFLNIWINDYNYGPKIISTIFGRGELSPYGQFAFAISNSLLLAKNSAETLESEEHLSEELKDINKNLDKIVKERTKALEKSTKKINEQNIILEEQNKKLNYLSFNDPLTGLWNRRKYNILMTKKWNKSYIEKKPLTLIIIDIDNFKEYNDYYGHMAGDKALKKVAITIKNSFSDITNVVARYGGEEFIALTYNIGKDKIIDSVKNMVKEVEKLKISNEKSEISSYITVSAGASQIVPKEDSSYEDLFILADKALYISKVKGKNQTNFL